MAVVLVGLVIAWPQIMQGSSGIPVPVVLVRRCRRKPDMLSMASPRYAGQTRHDRPYAVTAHTASLDPLQANLIHLDRPVADIASVTTATFT